MPDSQLPPNSEEGYRSFGAACAGILEAHGELPESDPQRAIDVMRVAAAVYGISLTKETTDD